MTVRLPLAVVLLSAAVAARAGLFGRDKVVSRWTAAPIAVNGDDADWDAESAFESDGLSVQARNDASDLYLIISAHTREGRDRLTGETRENVAIWFVGADGRTREWGAVLPFSHRAPLTAALRDPAGVDPEPEYARAVGPAVSTSSWPAEMPVRLASSARRPVWELKVPLKSLSRRPDGSVALDVVVTPAAKREGVSLSASVKLADKVK